MGDGCSWACLEAQAARMAARVLSPGRMTSTRFSQPMCSLRIPRHQSGHRSSTLEALLLLRLEALSPTQLSAREFGIPLVAGAIDATRVITDGAKIVVDGTAGIVEL